MAETRKKSTTTTKTKTVPAKKPATKPAGKSVKPKATKTVAAKTTTSKATTAKTAKSSTGKKGSLSRIIFSIIVAVAVVAVATCIIGGIICQNQTVMVENGKGDKIATKYISMDKKFEAFVPTSFKKLSDDEIKKEFGEDGPTMVYRNKEDTAYVSFIAPDSEVDVSNEQVSNYMELMKAILSTTATINGTETYDVDDHKVGILTFTIKAEGDEAYSQMALFSYEGKLASITFSCTKEVRGEWEAVSNRIMKSIRFQK